MITIDNKVQLIITIIPSSNSYSIPRLVPAETQGWRKHSKDAHALGEEGRTPCLHQDQYMLFMSYYVFFVLLPFMLTVPYDIYRTEDPTSREDAHPIYPRYPRVFLCVMIYCPLPTNLCEKGWGYHCRVLVWLLALLLN